MSACFQACGTEPVVNDAFINLQSDRAISTAHSFQTRGGRWSGPGDLYAFRFFRIPEISFALQTMDNSLELTTLLNTGKLVKDSEVNTAEKYEFILSAMLKSSMRLVLFSLSATRSLVPFRNELT